jgi:hypothetical protein
MTKPKPKRNQGDGQGQLPILLGDSILEKLLHQMPQEKREFVLLLMQELALPKDDPALPLLIALEYYVNLLQDIPEAMEAAADEALKKWLSSYAAIQEKLSGTVREIDQIRVRWGQDTRALIVDVQHMFDEARRLAIQRYEADLMAAQREQMKVFRREWQEVQAEYVRDVNRQSFWAAAGLGLAMSVGFFLLGLWLGGKLWLWR